MHQRMQALLSGINSAVAFINCSLAIVCKTVCHGLVMHFMWWLCLQGLWHIWHGALPLMDEIMLLLMRCPCMSSTAGPVN